MNVSSVLSNQGFTPLPVEVWSPSTDFCGAGGGAFFLPHRGPSKRRNPRQSFAIRGLICNGKCLSCRRPRLRHSRLWSLFPRAAIVSMQSVFAFNCLAFRFSASAKNSELIRAT